MQSRLTGLLQIALLAATALGCERQPAADVDGRSVAALESRVRSVCGRCHIAPPPDALPRAAWAEVIEDMARVPAPPGIARPSAEELDEAKTWYAERAPVELALPPRAHRGASSIDFTVSAMTPPGLDDLRLPSIAGLRFTRGLSRPGSVELLACDLRTRTLLHVDLTGSPHGPASGRTPLLPLLHRLAQPARVEIGDLDDDGRIDLLVANLGDIDPSNEIEGDITAALRRADGRLERRTLATGLGRPSDARAADFDGDGDLDVVVAAFGWRGPGELILLESRGWGADAPFEPRTLDERDGFIHAAPADLDGDGNIDIVALLSQEHEEVIAFMNSGELEFAPRVLRKAAHPSWGYSGMELVDLDADGDLDVLTSNGDSLDHAALKPYHGVEWLENEGGSFRARRIATLPGCERAIPTDLDADGDLDVVAVSFLPLIDPAEWRARDLDSIIWVEQREKKWIPHALERHACMHAAVDAGDFNGDGRPDLAVGNWVWIDRELGPRARADYVVLLESSR